MEEVEIKLKVPVFFFFNIWNNHLACINFGDILAVK